jgi:hypothetical protein
LTAPFEAGYNCCGRYTFLVAPVIFLDPSCQPGDRWFTRVLEHREAERAKG